MALNEDKYGKIQDYLDKKLSREDLIQFENELKTDQDLARELQLHQEMEAFLADTPENELRKNLQELNQEVEEGKVKTGNSWRFLLLLIPVLLLMAWWISSQMVKNTVPETAPPMEDVWIESEKKETSDDPAKEKELPEEDGVEELPPSVPKQQPTPSRKKPTEASRPIAANFDPNPSLEFLIENNRRDNEVTLEVEERQANIQVPTVGSNFDFRFVAVLRSATDLLQQDFKLHLFSNKKVDFEDFTPLSTNDLSLEKLTDDSYRIDFKSNLSLQPGRYYYILEDYTEEEIYFVDKFEVKLN